MQPNLKEIDVAILCGGLGTRLRTTIGEKQKTIAPVNGRPFLDILLESLAGQGFRRAILCTGFQADEIAERYAKGKFGLEIVCSPEAEPLGTGGAIKNAKRFIHSNPFVSLNGDCFCELNYRDFIASHVRRGAAMTLAVVRLKEKADYGSITLDVENRITAFREKVAQKNADSFISAGIYCFNQEVFLWMPEARKFMLEKDFFPLQTQRKIFGFESKGRFLDIGTPERFQEAQQLLRKAKDIL